jgi:hypothetical protein
MDIISTRICDLSDIAAIAAAQGWETRTPCGEEAGTPIVDITSLHVDALGIDIRERAQQS